MYIVFARDVYEKSIITAKARTEDSDFVLKDI